MFKDEQANVHDEEGSGQQSVVSDDLVQSFGKKKCERPRFSFRNLV
jgi:hypothetical protein